MELQHPFKVITPTLDGDVLNILAGVDASFTPGQLQRMMPHFSDSGVRKALQRLVGQGVVSAHQAGSAYLYRLNRDHLAAEPIIALARLRTTLFDRIRALIASWDIQPTYGAVFGSAARGDMGAQSDIDVFLVRPDRAEQDRWEDQVSGLSAAVTRWTGNDARVLEFSEQQVRDSEGEPVLRSIAAEGVIVSGEPTWFRRIMLQLERS